VCSRTLSDSTCKNYGLWVNRTATYNYITLEFRYSALSGNPWGGLGAGALNYTVKTDRLRFLESFSDEFLTSNEETKIYLNHAKITRPEVFENETVQEEVFTNFVYGYVQNQDCPFKRPTTHHEDPVSSQNSVN
jgi:hypothetical protein